MRVHSPFTHSHSPLHHAAPFPCGHSAQEFASWFPQFTGSGLGGCVVGGWMVGGFVVETMENETIRIHTSRKLAQAKVNNALRLM